MKKAVLGILLLIITFSTQAQEKKNKNAKFVIEVNGNCEQCQNRIQKAAFSVSGVKSAVWSMETHQLSLILNEEKATLLDVKNAVAKAGHDVGDVKATEVTYEKLPGCCQYDRK